ncbi:MAG: hypothetical protein GF392_03810 [Candidatus Omnitrophica bacterium]|nr:hypothetical protein [Candidatus Omnitrophota bacterium]
MRKIYWAAVVAYLGGLYLSIASAPLLWERIQSSTDMDLNRCVYLAGSVLAVSLLTYMVLIKREIRDRNYMFLVLFMAAFLLLGRAASRPAEKVHILEYVLLSFLVYNALRLDLNRFGKKLYVTGILFCLGAGLIDELIQLYIPSRVFDWRDVLINAGSSAVGFGIIRFNILKAPKVFTNTSKQ